MSQALEVRPDEEAEAFGIDFAIDPNNGSALVLCLDQRAGTLARAAVANCGDVVKQELPHVPRAEYLDPTRIIRDGQGGIEVSDTGQTERFYTTRLQHAGVLYTAFTAYTHWYSPGETRDRLNGYINQLGELALSVAEHSERRIPGHIRRFTPSLWLSEESIKFFSGYNLVEYFHALGEIGAKSVLRAMPKIKS